MRVAHVLHSFGIGGLEKGVATLVRHASPDLEHVIVCLESGGGSQALLPPGTRVVELRKGPGHSTRFLLRLATALRGILPDVVHTRNWGGLDGVIAARLARVRNVVHGEHGWAMDDPRGDITRRILIRRFLSLGMREVTCVSRQLRTWLETTVRVRAPITQIYNGVDVGMYRPSTQRGRVRAELEIAPEAFVVTICGRLDPIKDHRTLFDGFRAMRQANPEAVLLVVGDGPMRRELEPLAGAGIRLLGNREDVPTILGDSDVFALSSLNEGISNTILEAMASGLPVVATAVGGNPELVTDGISGALFPPGDSVALCRALSAYAAERDLRARHGAAGRRIAEERFSVATMAAAYEEVYRRVVGSSISRGPSG